MAKRGENIFRRKDGRWEARYIKGYESSGKIRYGFCYGSTYREAKEKAMQCRVALMNGTHPTAARQRRGFSFFCEEWLEIERGKVKDSTYVKYEAILRNHILPKLGAYLPQEFSTQMAEQFRQELLSEGFSTKTVRDILTALRGILNYAAGQYPGVFPVVEIRCPKEPKREARVLSPEEQERLITFLRTDMDECKFGLLLALQTGLRLGELCALRWENVSVRDRMLRVNATMQRLRDLDGSGGGRTKVVISTPKSDTSIRTIPLTEGAAQLCAQFDRHRPAAFLLTGTERYMEPRVVQKRLAKYTRECGLEGVHPHTIRHTFATRCVEAGFEIKSLSEILGHAATSVTLERYVHSSMELKRANMNRLTFTGL